MSARLYKANSGLISFAPLRPLRASRRLKDELQLFTYPSLGRAEAEHSSGSGSDTEGHTSEEMQTSVDLTISAEIAAAHERARQIVADGQADAERLLADTRLRCAEMEAEAFAQGEAAGRTSLHEEVARQVADLREQLGKTVTEIQSLSTEIISKGEREMVELAIEIAKKIVQREVTLDREVALTLARLALSRLHSRAKTTIRLHPEDFRYAVAHPEKLNDTNGIELIEDKSVGLGGCLVETEMGYIDARIAQQFRDIEQGFWDDTVSR
jgi:flagellar assembly protein FliH